MKNAYFLACIIMLAGCRGKGTAEQEQQVIAADSTPPHAAKVVHVNPHLNVDDNEFPRSYEGMFPCPDCPGLRTVLFISKDFDKFILVSEKFASGDKPESSRIEGKLNTERGYEIDKNATVYILNSDLPESEQQYFLRETGRDGEIMKLDSERKRMPGRYTLKVRR